MFKQLLNVMRSEHLDQRVTTDLRQMIGLAQDAVRGASAALFGEPISDEARLLFYDRDRRINALQQEIRKTLVSQLTLSSTIQLARLLVITGLIKDIERIGDHAKNLIEAAQMLDGPLPDDPTCRELREIAEAVEATLADTADVLESSDRALAERLCHDGQQAADRCERLLRDLKSSHHPASLAVPLALATRYYKRIQKHLMNLLSSVLMPLHKVDYFDLER